MLVVKGQEVPTKQGHILVLGIASGVHLKSGRSLLESLQEASDNEGIIIADHPFFHGGIGDSLYDSRVLEYFDAIEIFNGEALFGNNKARNFYNSVKDIFPNLGALSCSDGHSFYELGKCWTEIDAPCLDYQFLLSTLRNSIRRTDLRTRMMKRKSLIGVIDHTLDLACLKAFG